MLLAAAERRIGIAPRLAELIAGPRNPLQVTHSVVDILRARMLAIACGCGYEEPDTGDYLCSQPTL
jgi:Transposase DDE domain group 1